jgi:hypothetical protein
MFLKIFYKKCMCWVWRHELVSKTKVVRYNDYYIIQKSFDKRYFNSFNNVIVKQFFKKYTKKLMHSLQMYPIKGYIIKGITIGMWKETTRNWQIHRYEYLFGT